MSIEYKTNKLILPESPTSFEQLFSELQKLFPRIEIIQIKDRKPLYNFYNPDGADIASLLDPDHMPGITNFTTLAVSEEFNELQGQDRSNCDRGNIVEVASDPILIATMSHIASEPSNYGDSEIAKKQRGAYRKTAAESLRLVHKAFPIQKGEVLIGVKRCGSNILDELRAQERLEGNRLDIDAKRLRFRDNNILGAGIKLTKNQAEAISCKDIRLQEGVVAAGTTESAFMCEVRNRSIFVKSISCDAVLVCTPGGEYVHDLRTALRIFGVDRTSNKGGYLDENWYVRYSKQGPLFARLIERFRDGVSYFIGAQVVGDGGDLTSI